MWRRPCRPKYQRSNLKSESIWFNGNRFWTPKLRLNLGKILFLIFVFYHNLESFRLCLVHLLSQNLVRAYSNFLSMLNFLYILKIILVYSRIRFLYINWLIWVYQNCFEYTLKIWVYLENWGHSKQILRKQMD